MQSYPQVRNVTKRLYCRTSINKIWCWLIGLGGLIISNPVFSGWLSLCEIHPHNASVEISKQYFKANGESYWLFYSRQPQPHCENTELNIDPVEIEWLDLISPEKSSQIEKQVILQGTVDGGGKRITEIIEDKSAISVDLVDSLGLYQNLLPYFKLRAFGVEDRVSFSQQNQILDVRCGPGDKPAGLLLDVPQKKLPNFKNLQVLVNYKADALLQIGIADDARFQRGDPVLVNLSPSNSDIKIPVQNDQLDTQQAIHWSLICPAEKTRLVLNNFEVRFVRQSAKKQARNLWIWKPESWLNHRNELVDLLKKHQAKRVFISVEIDLKSQALLQVPALEEFIKTARLQGIDVWVVEGDPHATLPHGQTQFVRRAQIIEKFNQARESAMRLSGIQYDIEPYLVSGWELNQEQWFNAYVTTLQNIDGQISAPIEIVIPFWWQFKTVDNKRLLDRVAPYIDGINVMNYRTSVEQLQQFAQPFLEWGVAANKKVSIALEAGEVSDEERWHYALNKEGELWRVTGLSQPALILLRSEKASRTYSTFKFTHQSVLPGSKLSFNSNPTELLKILPDIEAIWSQWESFDGISLHGIESELYSDKEIVVK